MLSGHAPPHEPPAAWAASSWKRSNEAPVTRTTAMTLSTTTAVARRLTQIKRWCAYSGFASCAAIPRLPEALALRFEHVVLGEATGEAQKARVRDHPVRRPHAPAAHSPAALQQLERLHQAKPAYLAQAVEEPLDLADVGAVREDDP